MNIPITFHRENRHVRRIAVEHKRQRYYDSFDDVPHDELWQESEQIMVVVGAVYVAHVFHRTNNHSLDGGEWLNTLTGAAASW